MFFCLKLLQRFLDLRVEMKGVREAYLGGVGGELFLNRLGRCELVCSPGSERECLQRWRSSVWVWLLPFRSAGEKHQTASLE